MAYSPTTGLVYIPVQELSMDYRSEAGIDEPDFQDVGAGFRVVPGVDSTDNSDNSIPAVVALLKTGRRLGWDMRKLQTPRRMRPETQIA
jgi:hypothetical protein